LIASAVSACAHAVPPELADARSAYDRASHGQTAQLAPAEVHKARTALDQAEQAFADKPEAQGTRDLAYVALRKAQLAEVTASRASEATKKTQAESDLREAQVQKQADTNAALSEARAQLGASQQSASEAEARNKAMEERLSQLADVREDERGTVLTLSGSVLFASNKATLLPEAETKLNELSEALMTNGERDIRIEGYTDSRGSDASNAELSQRRAEAVRSYLVSRGYEPDRVKAEGKGESAPIASNDDPEGRANNRRVEIVIAPAK
jgi:outer membrane protein OmpA-like peptidoglycan-associated protein